MAVYPLSEPPGLCNLEGPAPRDGDRGNLKINERRKKGKKTWLFPKVDEVVVNSNVRDSE